MYDNIIITEPKWKSWAIETTTPLFTPDQCRQIIEAGRRQPPKQAQIGMGNPVAEQIQGKELQLFHGYLLKK